MTTFKTIIVGSCFLSGIAFGGEVYSNSELHDFRSQLKGNQSAKTSTMDNASITLPEGTHRYSLMEMKMKEEADRMAYEQREEAAAKKSSADLGAGSSGMGL